MAEEEKRFSFTVPRIEVIEITDIKVTMRNGELEIYAVGHAEDIAVCSAVSAILETAILGLTAVADAHPENVKINIEDLQKKLKIF